MYLHTLEDNALSNPKARRSNKIKNDASNARKTTWGHQDLLHAIPYDGGESTSIPPESVMNAPLQLQWRYHADPLLIGTAFVVYICMPNQNGTWARNWGDQSLPTHHMVAESRPLHLPLCLMRTPPRPYQRNNDTHKQNYASFVVYICTPNQNGAWATSCGHASLPTHHMVAERRPLQLPLCLMRTPPRLYQRNHDTHKQNYASFVVYICKLKQNGAWATSCGDASLPTHHMVAESRPLQLLLRRMRTPRRLYQRNHAQAKLRIHCCVSLFLFT